MFTSIQEPLKNVNGQIKKKKKLRPIEGGKDRKGDTEIEKLVSVSPKKREVRRPP